MQAAVPVRDTTMTASLRDIARTFEQLNMLTLTGSNTKIEVSEDITGYYAKICVCAHAVARVIVCVIYTSPNLDKQSFVLRVA